MPLITPADLGTHLYPEIIAEITRNDETIVVAAIDAAIGEAKLYLGRYDVDELLMPQGAADPLLQRMVKDIAVWHLLKLYNVSTADPRIRTAYEDTLATLDEIKKGSMSPAGWPYATATSAYTDGSGIAWQANEKRNNYY